jgi:hypothetical protein
MVALDRELADPEPATPTAVDERSAEHLAQLEPAEPRDVAAHPLGDMHREARFDLGPRRMTQPSSPRDRGLAARTRARTAVSPKLHLLLRSAHHLIGQYLERTDIHVKGRDADGAQIGYTRDTSDQR